MPKGKRRKEEGDGREGVSRMPRKFRTWCLLACQEVLYWPYMQKVQVCLFPPFTTRHHPSQPSSSLPHALKWTWRGA